MTQIFIKVPFALSGDKLAIPDAVQPGGEASFTQGYGPKYSEDPATTGLRLDREQSNQLFYILSADINQYQTESFPRFISTADNGGVAYSYGKFATVLYDAGSGLEVYQSLVAANTALPTDATKWRLLDPYNRLIERASPAFTGTPTAPTAAPGTNTTQIATTAFVLDQVSASSTKTVLTSSQIWNRATLLWTFSHALGKLPANGSLIWKCTSADGGFSVGDVVIMPLSAPQSNGVGVFGYMTKVTTTQCLLSVDTNSGLLLHQWNNQDVFEPASSKWTIEYSVSG